MTSLSSSSNPAVGGQPVAFTATVATVPPGGNPTGAVGFSFSAAHVVCSGGDDSIPLISGTATCQITSLPVPNSPIIVTVTYGGTPDFGASQSSPLSEEVDKAAVTMTVSSANNPPGGTGSGKPNNFMASLSPVSPSVATPTGRVTWTITSADGTTSIPCSNGTPARVNVHGTARCSVPVDQLTAVGAPWSVSALYSGDAVFPSASAVLIGGQTVHKASTKSYVTAAPNPAAHGTAVNISASVVAPPFAGTPTGTMTFSFSGTGSPTITCDGGTDTITLTASGATCALSSGLGSSGSPYTVQASYSGDGNDTASASKVKTITAH